MLRTQNSPWHRSENLLCINVSGSAQSVNCASPRHPSSPQHPELSSVVERAPTFPASMMPMVNKDAQFHSMDPIAFEYHTTLPSTHTSCFLPFSDYRPTADSRAVGDAYDSYMSPLESFGNPTNFGEMFFEPLTAHQPPMPPAAPEDSTPPNSVFHYHPCRWLGGPRCDGFAPGRNREMGEHLRVYHHFIGHERDTVQCEWENCGQTMQRMNVPRHIVSRHLLAAASCRFCGKRFSRPDVVARHEKTCTGIVRVSSGSSARI